MKSIKALRCIKLMNIEQLEKLKIHIRIMIQEREKSVNRITKAFDEKLESIEDNDEVIRVIDESKALYLDILDSLKDSKKIDQYHETFLPKIEQLDSFREEEINRQKKQCGLDIGKEEIPIFMKEMEMEQYRYWVRELKQMIEERKNDSDSPPKRKSA